MAAGLHGFLYVSIISCCMVLPTLLLALNLLCLSFCGSCIMLCRRASNSRVVSKNSCSLQADK